MSSQNKQIQILNGSVLFREGDQGDCAYVIEEGKILVYLEREGEEVPISLLKKGEIFGEMSLIDNLPRSASVKALEDCVLAVITKDQLLERFNSSDSLVQLLLKVMMNRVRKNNSSYTQIQDLNANLDQDLDQNGVDAAIENLKLENRLQEALNNNEFEMFYQPIINIKLNQAIGCEALIRWKDPLHGYVQPDKFIDFLENSRLITPVGNWIFERCFQDYHKLKALFGQDFMMSINVSSRQFVHPEFMNDLEKLTWTHKIQSKNIKLEVTERVMMDGSVALDILSKCKAKGFNISIDDFGTGFSSLSYLRDFPADYLKIDRSFVCASTKDEKSKAITFAVIDLAHRLKMGVIAEGVETEQQLQLLSSHGCNDVQGFLFSKPVGPFQTELYWRQRMSNPGRALRCDQLTQSDDAAARTMKVAAMA